MDRRRFLASSISLATGLLLLSGCGGANESASATRAPVPPDPNEVQFADIVFDGVILTDRYGAEITPEKQQEITREHKNRVMIYTYDSKWGWHWLYMAYDTGHPYNPPEFSYRPHLNFAVYYRYSDMQQDINNRENKRSEYDGHFFIYRRSGSIICFRYDVSIDKKDPSNRGNKYDVCYGMPNASAVSVAFTVLSVVGISAAFAPYLVPAIVLLPVGL